MEYIVHRSYGGFSVPRALFHLSGNRAYLPYEEEEDFRANQEAINWIKSQPHCPLGVVTIPEAATDWELAEYDGAEHIIAVVDGKIEHLYAKRGVQ